MQCDYAKCEWKGAKHTEKGSMKMREFPICVNCPGEFDRFKPKPDCFFEKKDDLTTRDMLTHGYRHTCKI